MADRRRGLFDAGWWSDLLPGESIYALLAEHGDRIVRDGDFADCYSERQGRPPPSLLARVLLAYRDGLSDERAVEAVRFDLRWKVALDLPLDHPGFIRPAGSAFAPGCCSTAWGGWSSSARSSSPAGSA